MKNNACLFLLFVITGCAHTPKCGNPEGAKVILAGEKTCAVRIRQVTLGSELKIPESLKDAKLADFNLEWVEPSLEAGRIELGHFVLVQPSVTPEVKR